MKIDYKTPEGKDDSIYIDENLYKNTLDIKDSVLHKGWDYPAIIAGIPGVGKSTFGQQLCKALDPTFNVDRICFTANEFVEKTSHGNIGEAYMLDESFADLNSKAAMTPEFVKIINHLQLIRQRGLYLILILPDFFSLSKNVAIFRANHLFVIYHSDYQRGRFAAFDRERKKTLYIKGKPFLNYQCVPPNFRGRFVQKWVVDEKEYERRKYEHLISNNSTAPEKRTKASKARDRLLAYCRFVLKMTYVDLAKICKIDEHLAGEGAMKEFDWIREIFALDETEGDKAFKGKTIKIDIPRTKNNC